MLDTDFQELVTIPTAANIEQFVSIISAGISLKHCNRARKIIKKHETLNFKQITEITPILDADLLVYFLDNDETVLMLAKSDMRDHIISLQGIISDEQVSGEEVIKFIGELAKNKKFDLITFLIENSEIMIQAITNRLPPGILMSLEEEAENDENSDLLDILSQVSRTRRCVNASVNNKHCLYELYIIFGKDLSNLLDTLDVVFQSQAEIDFLTSVLNMYPRSLFITLVADGLLYSANQSGKEIFNQMHENLAEWILNDETSLSVKMPKFYNKNENSLLNNGYDFCIHARHSQNLEIDNVKMIFPRCALAPDPLAISVYVIDPVIGNADSDNSTEVGFNDYSAFR